MTRVHGPRGAPDLLPPDSELLAEVEATARSLFDRYGYRRVETPVFEHTDVFQRAVGDASEVAVEKQMYTFEDPSGRSLSLRPEGTAGVARAFAEHRPDGTQPMPLRWWYVGPMFRYERPQKGRDRQFVQAGVELIGSDQPIADAEVIALGKEFFDEIGLEPDLLINTMGHAPDREAYFPLLREALQPYLADMCDDCRTRLETNPLRVFDCKVPGCKKILAAHAPPITEHVCDDCRARFASVQELLDGLGVAWKLAPELVRGFDYYTRTVFEFVLPSLGARSTVCGGGRYDGLIELLGGPPTPALGFAIGIAPVLVALTEAGRTATWRPDVYVAWMEGLGGTALRVARDMRASGRRVVVADQPRSLKTQLRAADRSGAHTAVIVGPQEVERGVVTVRDLETGEQREVALGGIGGGL